MSINPKIIEQLETLAEAIWEGDRSAWTPLQDLMIEIGWEQLFRFHSDNGSCMEESKKCHLIRILVRDFELSEYLSHPVWGDQELVFLNAVYGSLEAWRSRPSNVCR